MSIESIIALIVSIVAVLISGSSLFVSIINFNISNRLAIKTNGRIKYLDGMREAFSQFVGLTDYDVVKYAITCENKDFLFIPSLSTATGKFKSYVKPFYEIDYALLSLMDTVFDNAKRVFHSQMEDEESYNSARKQFMDLYAQYDWAYWIYIQRQSNGKDLNSGNNFDECYKEFLDELITSKSEKYTII